MNQLVADWSAYGRWLLVVALMFCLIGGTQTRAQVVGGTILGTMRRSRVVQCKRRCAPERWTWRGSKITESSCASRNFSGGRWIPKRDQKRSGASNGGPGKPEKYTGSRNLIS